MTYCNKIQWQYRLAFRSILVSHCPQRSRSAPRNMSYPSDLPRSSASNKLDKVAKRTPFDMVVLNQMSRFHLCMEALRRSDYPQAAIRDDFTCADSSTKGRQPLCTGLDPVFLKAGQLIFESAGRTVVPASHEGEIKIICSKQKFDVAVIGQS
jgi:XFP-like protein